MHKKWGLIHGNIRLGLLPNSVVYKSSLLGSTKESAALSSSTLRRFWLSVQWSSVDRLAIQNMSPEAINLICTNYEVLKFGRRTSIQRQKCLWEPGEGKVTQGITFEAWRNVARTHVIFKEYLYNSKRLWPLNASGNELSCLLSTDHLILLQRTNNASDCKRQCILGPWSVGF